MISKPWRRVIIETRISFMLMEIRNSRSTKRLPNLCEPVLLYMYYRNIWVDGVWRENIIYHFQAISGAVHDLL